MFIRRSKGNSRKTRPNHIVRLVHRGPHDANPVDGSVTRAVPSALRSHRWRDPAGLIA